MSESLRAKLYSRTTVTENGCWEWSGAKTTAGYGELIHNKRHFYAHRASWTLHYGPIPAKAHVLHHCDNPSCFRPEHLFLGNDQTNTDDKIAKGRMRHGHLYGDDHPARKHPETFIKRGEEHHNARITWDIVRQIRARYAAGERKADIAKAFGINRGSVHYIVNNEEWIEESGNGQR